MTMDNHEIHEIAKQAAHETLVQFFLSLGIDVSDPKSLIEFQKDLSQMRGWRESTETIKRKGIATAVTVVVTGLLGWAWMAFSGGGITK